jgi:hypothetical protein
MEYLYLLVIGILCGFGMFVCAGMDWDEFLGISFVGMVFSFALYIVLNVAYKGDETIDIYPIARSIELPDGDVYVYNDDNTIKEQLTTTQRLIEYTTLTNNFSFYQKSYTNGFGVKCQDGDLKLNSELK